MNAYLGEGTSSALTPVLELVSEFFESAVGWMLDISGKVIEDPLLTLMVICIPIVGIGIGMLGRLIRL